jgi:hypothetical protein
MRAIKATLATLATGAVLAMASAGEGTAFANTGEARGSVFAKEWTYKRALSAALKAA